MTNEEIVKKLDEIDVLMINSLDEKHAFKSNEDANEVAKKITQLQGYITGKSPFYKRFTILNNAFMFSYNKASKIEKEALDAQKYFNWLDFEKIFADKEQKREVIKPDDALKIYDAEIETGHKVDEKIKDILELQYRIQNDNLANKNNNLPKKLSFFDKLRNNLKKLTSKLFKKHEKESNVQYEEQYQPESINKERVSNQQKNFANRYYVKPAKIVQPPIDKPIRKDEIIVVSDLHGNMLKWGYVRKALEKNPGLKVIVEGDAMDRGPYGLEILMEIRELSAEGRVMYLPGNHDEFAYDYLKTQGTEYEKTVHSQIAKKTWELNGGNTTISKFIDYEKVLNEQIEMGNIKQRISKQELIDWLGNCQIQIKMQTKGMKYALSHAMFDEDLYNADPYFNLEKALALKLQNREDNIWLKKFRNCMWYREDHPELHYADLSWPKDYVVIVGHTRQNNINMKEINNDPNKPIVYIDCGKGSLQAYNITENEHVDLEPKAYRGR